MSSRLKKLFCLLIVFLVIFVISESRLPEQQRGLEYDLSRFQSLADLNALDYSPKGLDQDQFKNIYITLSKANVVGKFSPSGELVGWIGYDLKQKKFITNWNKITTATSDSGDMVFQYPHTLRVHGQNLYITEHYNHQVKKFNLVGDYLGTLGVLASGELSPEFIKDSALIKTASNQGLFAGIACIGIDSEANIFISDYSSGSVIKFDPDGQYLGWVGKRKDGELNKTWSKSGTPVKSHELGAFNGHHSISFDSQGFIYVTDTHNHRIVKLTPSGQSIAWLGETSAGDISESWSERQVDTKVSSRLGGFNAPIDLIFDQNHNLIILEAFGNRIQKISPEGKSLGWIGATDQGQILRTWYTGEQSPAASSLPGGFNLPYHLIQDNLYYLVTGVNNRRLQKIKIPVE